MTDLLWLSFGVLYLGFGSCLAVYVKDEIYRVYDYEMNAWHITATILLWPAFGLIIAYMED